MNVDYEHLDDRDDAAIEDLVQGQAPVAEGDEQAAPDDDAILANMKKTRKVMAPRPKLNEARLVNDKTGLPVLAKKFQNWKYDEKKDEFANLDSVLHGIEHWAHRLFPQIKFDDFIERAEHLGVKTAVRTTMFRIRNDMPLTDEDYNALHGDGHNENEVMQTPETMPDDSFVDEDATTLNGGITNLNNEDDEYMNDVHLEDDLFASAPIILPPKPLPIVVEPKPSGLSDETKRLIEEKRLKAIQLREQRLKRFDPPSQSQACGQENDSNSQKMSFEWSETKADEESIPMDLPESALIAKSTIDYDQSIDNQNELPVDMDLFADMN